MELLKVNSIQSWWCSCLVSRQCHRRLKHSYVKTFPDLFCSVWKSVPCVSHKNKRIMSYSLCGSWKRVLKFMLYSKKQVKMCELSSFLFLAPSFPWSLNMQIERFLNICCQLPSNCTDPPSPLPQNTRKILSLCFSLSLVSVFFFFLDSCFSLAQ